MSDALGSTPATDGFHMPGEFEPHAGTWMLWPVRGDTWREDARPAEEAFAAVAEAIAVVEPVTVGVLPARMDRARAALSDAVKVVPLVTNDAWMRDVGPTVVVNGAGERRAVDWIFNAWGGAVHGLYDDWADDDRVAVAVADAEGMPRYRCPLIQEGGGLHADGQGTLIVTEECVLSAGRNAALGRGGAEALLCAYTGAERVIWLPEGVVDDETTGHIDNLIHLVAADLALLTWPTDARDPQRPRSEAAQRELERAGVEVRRLPMPGPLFMTVEEAAGLVPRPDAKPRRAGDRLAASYANFYLCNGRAVVPLLDPRTDEAALRIIAEALPDRAIVGVPGREILLGGGNIHCLTQQIPVGAAQG
ncbi:MAG: agmatine deiminase [Alphaproteobacteria bacterium]|nr:agmatine deiminase [Alphaproteobacteria bacterium]